MCIRLCRLCAFLVDYGFFCKTAVVVVTAAGRRLQGLGMFRVEGPGLLGFRLF